jgi:hypothetical protein
VGVTENYEIVHYDSPIPQRRVVLVASAAVGFAFALVLLPGPARDVAEIWIAVGLAVVVVGLSALWSAAPASARVALPLAYVALVAVLLDGGGGTSSGFGGLFLLPLLWLAVVGGRAELLTGLVAVALAPCRGSSSARRRTRPRTGEP